MGRTYDESDGTICKSHKWVISGTYQHNVDDQEKVVFGINLRCANGCRTTHHSPIENPYKNSSGVCFVLNPGALPIDDED